MFNEQEKVIEMSSKIYEEAAKAAQEAQNADASTDSNDDVKEAKYEEK